MAKNSVPEIQVWKLREKCRQLQSALVALEAKSHGQSVEIEQLRSALRGAPDVDSRGQQQHRQ